MISFVAIAASAALALPVSAATFSGIGSGGQAIFRYEVNGQLRQSSRSAGTLRATAELLPGIFQLTQARLTNPGFTLTDSFSITNPLTFQSKTYGLSLTVNPFSIAYSGPETALFANGSALRYESQDSFPMTPFNLSGSYTVTGPGEVASGNFSIQPGDLAGPELGDVTTTGFPNQITWRQFNLFGVGAPDADPTGTLFSQTVDGENIRLAFTLFTTTITTPLTMNAVPEPSTLVLGGIGLAICAARRKRILR